MPTTISSRNMGEFGKVFSQRIVGTKQSQLERREGLSESDLSRVNPRRVLETSCFYSLVFMRWIGETLCFGLVTVTVDMNMELMCYRGLVFYVD